MGNNLQRPNAKVGAVFRIADLDCQFIGQFGVQGENAEVSAAANHVDLRQILEKLNIPPLPQELSSLNLFIETLYLHLDTQKNYSVYCDIGLKKKSPDTKSQGSNNGLNDNMDEATRQERIVSKRQFFNNGLFDDKGEAIWHELHRRGCIQENANETNIAKIVVSEKELCHKIKQTPQLDHQHEIKQLLYPQLSLGSSDLPIATLKFELKKENDDFTVAFNLHSDFKEIGGIKLLSPYFVCQDFDLTFVYEKKENEEAKWFVSGGLGIDVFNKYIGFSAEYKYQKEVKVLTLKAEGAEILPLKVFPDPLPVLPGLPDLRESFIVGLKEVSLEKNGDGWAFSIDIFLAVKRVDAEIFGPINKFLFPKPEKTSELVGELVIGSNGTVALALKNELPLIVPSIFSKTEFSKDLQPLKDRLDVGDSYFCLNEIEIKIKDDEFNCYASLAFGLPSKLNDALFGKNSELNGLIKTYKETQNNEGNLIIASLQLGSGGISGNIDKGNVIDIDKLSNILEKITGGPTGFDLNGLKEESKYYEINFDVLLKNTDGDGKITEEFGWIKIDKPALKLDSETGAFEASGGYLISKQLMIPIQKIVSALIRAVPQEKRDQGNLDAIANFFPKTIPVRSINFFKGNAQLSWETRNADIVEIWENRRKKLFPPELETPLSAGGTASVSSGDAATAEPDPIPSLPASGTVTVSPEKTTTYRLIARNSQGQIEQSVTVEVGSDDKKEITRSTPVKIDTQEDCLEIVAFEADPSQIGREKQLNLSELEKWLQDFLPGAAGSFTLPAPFKQFVEREAGKVVNKLPDAFKEYLSIKLPRGFKFAIEVAADGGINFSVEVAGQKSDRNHFYPDCIQLLVPVPGGFGTIYGIQLKKLAFGTALGGVCLRLDLSARMDVFDLVQLGASLLLPDKDKKTIDKLFPALDEEHKKTLELMIPDRRKFGHHQMVENLVMLIVYETVVPIPIPLFYNKIYSAYSGVEGLESETLLSFDLKINVIKLLSDLLILKDFFTKKDKTLPVANYPYDKELEKSGVLVGVGPIYTQLPGYIGFEEVNGEKQNIVIGTKGSYEFDQLDLIRLGVNTIKFMGINFVEALGRKKPGELTKVSVLLTDLQTQKKEKRQKRPLNYLIEYLPVDMRVGTKKIWLFHCIEFEAAWAFATPDEFEQVAYGLMRQKYADIDAPETRDPSSSNDLLQLLAERDAPAARQEEDQGVVLFLRGGMYFAARQVVLEGAIGLSISEQKGFRTGLSLKGKLFNWIESGSFFFAKINPAAESEFVKVLGSTYLKVFERDVLKGRIEVTNDILELQGMLDAFPDGFPVQLKGYVDGKFIANRIEAGKIKPGSIQFYGSVGLQLGFFSASAMLKLLITDNHQLLESDLTFGNSFWHFAVEHKTEETQGWFRADLSANAFNLIALEGHLRFKREARRMQLLGMIALRFPALKILDVQLDYAGELNGEAGFLSFSARLGSNSYILSENCRPTGGAAFCIWFLDEPAVQATPEKKAVSTAFAGDFVLTVGGYHPNFRVPPHYPRVPRLGINWEIDANTHIRGEAYFAVTPLAIMAGAKLDLVYQKGNVRAWFLAYADFLCQWKPLYYDANIGVSVGASYTLRIGVTIARRFIGVTKTFSISLKAQLHLYGPPTGGRIDIKLPIVTIGIRFGKPYRPPPPIKNWQAFKKELLDNDKKGAAGGILQIVPQSGICVIADPVRKDTVWTARADELSFMITTKLPAGKVSEEWETNNLIDIKPLNKERIKSTLTVTLKNGRQVNDAFRLKPIKGNVPAALWGKPKVDLLDSKNTLVTDMLTGYHVHPQKAQSEGAALQVFEHALEYSDIYPQAEKRKLPHARGKITPVSLKPGSLDILRNAVDDTRNTRQTVLDELEASGLFHKGDSPDLDYVELAGTMESDWRHWPDVAESSPVLSNE